jgi:hypothetical protein
MSLLFGGIREKVLICWQCEITGLQRDDRRILQMQFRDGGTRLPLV